MRSWRIAKALGATRRDGLLGEINASAPSRNKDNDGGIGDASHSARASDHNPNDEGVVCARDFTHDPKGGFDSYKFAEWLRQRVVSGEEERVKYCISNRKIFSGPRQGHPLGKWRRYSGSNPHDEHVHVSVRNDPKYWDDTSPWHWPDSSPQPISKG